MAEKLVRDRIPEKMRGSGREPNTRTLTATEYASALRDKLMEEVAEYLADGGEEELADILEVVIALGALQGVTPAKLERLRVSKRQQCGGFDERLALRLP